MAFGVAYSAWGADGSSYLCWAFVCRFHDGIIGVREVGAGCRFASARVIGGNPSGF